MHGGPAVPIVDSPVRENLFDDGIGQVSVYQPK
jgi:hypothetical protein